MTGNDRDHDRTSLSDAEIAALAKMARSPLARPVIAALALIALNALSGTVGWIAAKIDVKTDVAALSKKIDTLTGSTKNNTDGIADIKKALKEALDAPNGRVPQIEYQQMRMRHEIAVATGAALAYEKHSRQVQKLKAGEDLLGQGYDNILKDDPTTPPAVALKTAIKTIALPQE